MQHDDGADKGGGASVEVSGSLVKLKQRVFTTCWTLVDRTIAATTYWRKGTGPRTGAYRLCVSRKWKREVLLSERSHLRWSGFSTRECWILKTLDVLRGWARHQKA